MRDRGKCAHGTLRKSSPWLFCPYFQVYRQIQSSTVSLSLLILDMMILKRLKVALTTEDLLHLQTSLIRVCVLLNPINKL